MLMNPTFLVWNSARCLKATSQGTVGLLDGYVGELAGALDGQFPTISKMWISQSRKLLLGNKLQWEQILGNVENVDIRMDR